MFRGATSAAYPPIQAPGVVSPSLTVLRPLSPADFAYTPAPNHPQALRGTIKAAEPRWWRVSVIKKKLIYLGRVPAVDKASAAVEANKEFTTLTDHERSRLVIEEQQ